MTCKAMAIALMTNAINRKAMEICRILWSGIKTVTRETTLTAQENIFFVPKAEIVENEYDLSLSKYKEEIYWK